MSVDIYSSSLWLLHVAIGVLLYDVLLAILYGMMFHKEIIMKNECLKVLVLVLLQIKDKLCERDGSWTMWDYRNILASQCSLNDR